MIDGANVVATLGGDGKYTVMAVLPGGTANYFSRGLGRGNDLPDAIDALLSGRVTRMGGPWHLKVRRNDLRVIVPPETETSPEAGKNSSK